MKESVLDVLMYLFEHYLDEDTDGESDQESLKRELTRAGFPDSEISKAFEWLEGLTAEGESDDGETPRARAGASTRVYTREEAEKIDLEGRGFLVFLEQVGLLDVVSRELVIDRVMALDTDGIDLEQLKWVVLMVLFNQPGHEGMYAWMEDLVFEPVSGRLH